MKRIVAAFAVLLLAGCTSSSASSTTRIDRAIDKAAEAHAAFMAGSNGTATLASIAGMLDEASTSLRGPDEAKSASIQVATTARQVRDMDACFGKANAHGGSVRDECQVEVEALTMLWASMGWSLADLAPQSSYSQQEISAKFATR